MKRKLAGILSILLLQATAYAQIPNVVYDRSRGEIIISGVSEDGAYKPVTAELKINEGLGDITVVSADADAAYEAVMQVADATRLYTVVINGNADESVSVMTFARRDIENAVAEFSAADTVEKMRKFFTDPLKNDDVESDCTNADILGFDNTDISDKDELYSMLSRGCSDKTTLEKATQFYNDISISAVFRTCSEEMFTQTVSKYEAKLGFDSSEVYELYGKMSTDECKAVCRIMQRVKPSTASETKDSLEKGTVLAAIIKSGYYKTAADLMKEYADLLEINLAEYNSLSQYNRDEAMKRIVSLDESAIGTPEKFANKLDEIIGDIKESGNNKTSGGSGGSGSGSGGLRGGIASQYSDDVENIPDSVTMAFVDMNNYEWATDAVSYLAARGIVNGKKDYFFCPEENVTRAEFAKMIVAAFDLSGTSDKDFDDVPENLWSYKYISTAYANGIVTGVGDDSFEPDAFITRQDIAVMVARALEHKTNSEKVKVSEFLDAAEIDDYAKACVDMMSAYGIINGMGDGRFAPKMFAKRAEAAKIIYGAMNIATQN